MTTPRQNFLPGRDPTPSFLNRIQDPVRFDGQSRIDYWNDSELRQSWGIHQRDGIKDYEVHPDSSMAATAYYGLIKGAIVDPDTNIRIEPTIGRPRSYVTPLTVPGFVNVEIYGGSIVNVDGEILTWDDLELTIPDNATSFGFVDRDGIVVVDSSLPANTDIFTPLFRLIMSSGSISIYDDLRPNSHLSYHPDNYFVLLNTPLISDNYQANSWERVLCDTAIYSFRVTLPSSPSDSDRVAVADIRGIASSQSIIVNGGAININGSSANYVVNNDFGHVVFYYSQAENSWFIESVNTGSGNNSDNNLFPIDYKEITSDYTIQETDYRTWIDADSSLTSRIITLPGNLEFGFEFFVQSMGGTTVFISPENIEFSSLSLTENQSTRIMWLDDTDFGGNGVWKAIQPGGGGGSGSVTITGSDFPRSNEEVLIGTYVLSTGDENIQILNPNGVARDVILPDPPETNDFFTIINDSDGLSANGNTLNIKESSGGGVVFSLDDTSGQLNVNCIYTGTRWVIYD